MSQVPNPKFQRPFRQLTTGNWHTDKSLIFISLEYKTQSYLILGSILLYRGIYIIGEQESTEKAVLSQPAQILMCQP